MREMKPETIELLKSRKMIGADKFNYELKLEGSEYYSEVKERKTIRVAVNKTGGDFVIRSDGKVLFLYKFGSGVYLKVIDSENHLMSQEISVTDGTLFYSCATSHGKRNASLLRLKNGKIWLFIIDIGVTNGSSMTIKLYESINGLGDDFAYKSTIYEVVRTKGVHSLPDIGKGVESNDNVFINASVVLMDNVLAAETFRLAVFSTDNYGDSWQKKYEDNVAFVDTLKYSYMQNMVSIGYYIFTCVPFQFGAIRNYCFYSMNGGLSWAKTQAQSVNLDLQVFFNGAIDELFLLQGNKIYKYNKNNAEGISAFFNMYNYDLYCNQDIYHDYNTMLLGMMTPRGTLHLITDIRATDIYDLLMIREKYSAQIKASSINISKGRGGANTLSLSVDNSNGSVNPRNQESELYKIINLNKQIIIKQGYGEDLVETFTGLIDSFNMQSYPHTMEIACRDHLKKALDQTITESGSHTVFFESQPIENIFGYLCYLAGIETGQIDQTGINISKEFSWQSYADAFQFLADLASFEYGADEYGKVYFRRDFQPDELAIAYTFEEGVDITTLAYQLSDNDLYSKVQVYGKSGETVIGYEALFPDAAKYNIMPQKILKVDATEASTIPELKKIADRSIYLMNSRTAIVNFTAIAVPWLQVSDFIQVNESSSMSAGIYRISSLNLKMTDKDFLMDLQCYYYGDSIETGTLPEVTATQTGNATLNLIPEMTSNTSPSGIARASSVLTLYDNDYQPWNAFNSTSDDLYWNAVAQYGWIEYQFMEKTIIDKYMLKARQTLDYNRAMPKNWTFEGFDGEKWIVLDTKSNQAAWQIHEERSFNFINTVAYSKYRLNVSANNGFHRLQLEQLAMYYRGGV